MESSELNQVNIPEKGYSTPPRSNITFEYRTRSQPKLLTSDELKRRFSPIHLTNKKRRYNLIRNNDSIVPLERNLNMPVILKNLFDKQEDDCKVPYSSMIHHSQPIFNYSNSLKTDQENTFSISETVIKQKLKILLGKQ